MPAHLVPDDGLEPLAYQTGHADQAHLIRDIRELTGLSPVRLREERGRHALEAEPRSEGGSTT